MLNLDLKSIESIKKDIEALELRLSREFGKQVKLSIVEINDIEQRELLPELIFMNLVVNTVAEYANVSVKRLISKSREVPLPDYRYMIYQIIKDTYPKISLKTIGTIVGGRDHTTVLQGLYTFQNLWQTEEQFRLKYKTIKQLVKNEQYHLPKSKGDTLSGLATYA